MSELSFAKWWIFGEIMQVTDADRRLLRHLQAEPDISNAALAERAGMTAATCTRRLEKLRQAGVIRATRVRIDWRALGYEVEVSLRVTLDKTNPRAFDEFLAAAREVPEAYEIQTFLGQVDVRLNILARDMAHYQAIYRDRILTLPHIADIEALMHVSDIKKHEALPL
ncbi:MAG: AsnC family transcriptional regulator [Rhodovulum sp.]|jgi:Lrp/AsnC family transcriptional regulator|nr:AsnC family transcriptional regulator [Rhodovulum sp.]